MYAIVNHPGSSYFRWFGPARKDECEEWLLRVRRHALYVGQRLETLRPQRIISNKEAASWRWQDGSKIFLPRLPYSFEKVTGEKL